jgi:hypothetical protein
MSARLTLRARAGCLAGSLLHLAGCSRAPLPRLCPNLESGALVISEIHGNASSRWGQWIELHNQAGVEIPLAAIVLRTSTLMATRESILVRSSSLRVAPDDYVVLGRFTDDQRPPHVDYAYAVDFEGDFPAKGILEVYSCERLVDRVVFEGLPSNGSYSFDGSAWCTDTVTTPLPDGGSANTPTGPGTPGARNRPCK